MNKLYEVEFWDHCRSGDAKIIKCKVVGWFHSEDEMRLSLTPWETEGKPDHDELINIVKACIIEEFEIKFD